MMNFLKFLFKSGGSREQATHAQVDRKALEQKAIQGAEKAVKEYRQVFERLAEYDKTS